MLQELLVAALEYPLGARSERRADTKSFSHSAVDFLNFSHAAYLQFYVQDCKVPEVTLRPKLAHQVLCWSLVGFHECKQLPYFWDCDSATSFVCCDVMLMMRSDGMAKKTS
jgi:hypothetical protein